MNNAIKHAQATAIERALPGATHRQLDHDHRQRSWHAASRTDSHGLKIMRERARLIDAELTIERQSRAAGSSVSVHVGSDTGGGASDTPPEVSKR